MMALSSTEDCLMASSQARPPFWRLTGFRLAEMFNS
jgi:hypothetical protein